MPCVRIPGSRAAKERRHELSMHLLQSHLGQLMALLIGLTLAAWWGHHATKNLRGRRDSRANTDVA